MHFEIIEGRIAETQSLAVLDRAIKSVNEEICDTFEHRQASGCLRALIVLQPRVPDGCSDHDGWGAPRQKYP
jgi:hypothetical protein